MKIKYDPQADAMYIQFSDNRKSSRTEVSGNGIIMDYEGDELVGIEILEVSRKFSKKDLDRVVHTSPVIPY